MISRKTDMLVGLGIVVGSTFLFYDSLSIPDARFEPMGSAILPQIVLGLMICLAMIEIGRAAYNHFIPTSEEYKILKKEELEEYPEENSIVFRHEWQVRTAVTLAVLAAYTLVLTYELVNYYIITFIFSVGLTSYLARWSKKYTLISVIVISVILGLLYVLSKTLALVLPTM